VKGLKLNDLSQAALHVCADINFGGETIIVKDNTVMPLHVGKGITRVDTVEHLGTTKYEKDSHMIIYM
jgi:hypothetical protein